jgi:hypothetical protein
LPSVYRENQPVRIPAAAEARRFRVPFRKTTLEAYQYFKDSPRGEARRDVLLT